MRVAPSQVTKMSLRTSDPVLHICEGLGMRLLTNVLHYSLSLYPNGVLNLDLRHSSMFAYSQTGRTFSIFFKFTLAPPYHKTLSAPSLHDYFSFGVQCVSNCFIDRLAYKPDADFYPTFNMLLAVSALKTTSNKQWVHEYMPLQPNSFQAPL